MADIAIFPADIVIILKAIVFNPFPVNSYTEEEEMKKME